MDVTGVDVKRISHSEDFSAANSVTMLSRTELPAHKSAQDEMLEISGIFFILVLFILSIYSW